MRTFQFVSGGRLELQREKLASIGRLLNVNRRIGSLMKIGRESMELDIESFASHFGLTVVDVQRWESGFGTLQASLFAEIVVHFSDDIQWKFQLLINQLQGESRILRDELEPLRVLLTNYDALGVAYGLKKIA